MYVCMYVCMYRGVYMYIYIYIYVCMYVYWCIYIYNITEFIKLCANLQFVSKITDCVLIQITLIEIFLALIHIID